MRVTVWVRKHPAPKGALRLAEVYGDLFAKAVPVRKHPAPKGALRLNVARRLGGSVLGESESTQRQKVH